MRNLAIVLLCGSLFTGCDSTPATARVSGQLTYEGQPFSLPRDAGEVFIVFRFVNNDGTIDQFKMYTAVVDADGQFEVVSSGGEQPVGIYQVAIDAASGKVEQFKPFEMTITRGRIEFKPGKNRVRIDLAKPMG